MAHSLSAKKRIRQNAKRRIMNRGRRSALRTTLRRCREAFQHGTVEQATDAYRAAARLLDREANRGLIHRNQAARRKSRMMRRLNEMKAKAST